MPLLKRICDSLVIVIQSNCNELDCLIIYSLFPNTYGVLFNMFWYQEISVCNCVITWKMCSWPEESDAAFCSKVFFRVMNVEVIHFFVLNNQWNITRNRYTYWYLYWPVLKRISHIHICSFFLWILNGKYLQIRSVCMNVSHHGISLFMGSIVILAHL